MVSFQTLCAAQERLRLLELMEHCPAEGCSGFLVIQVLNKILRRCCCGCRLSATRPADPVAWEMRLNASGTVLNPFVYNTLLGL